MSHFTFDVTNGNFQEQVLQSRIPVLVDFTAEWCPPCKMIAPLVDAIAQKYQGQLSVGTLDADAYPEIQDRYDVMGLPTLILFKDGLPVERIVGFKRRDQIEAKIEPFLNREKA